MQGPAMRSALNHRARRPDRLALKGQGWGEFRRQNAGRDCSRKRLQGSLCLDSQAKMRYLRAPGVGDPVIVAVPIVVGFPGGCARSVALCALSGCRECC